ncbi:hypothetical protein PSECIP111854_02059 [Pseudoalteromonas sp. CIP111854]|uniref:Uncharacterized protein n=1 Tax=Pseudoalteromonas holothuriae TaxID=2963714 RepID=A0A9W4QY14_9GAMM|nr:hypothetical protein [Pseudoalteromonas sp. CIP111854]CAH9057742.1 hypothetical protein PSECIP111854_02059 [Pseudoalteromonas sp. CIP111854]
MAILTRAGRIELAKAVERKPIYLAWGQGAIEWDSQLPPEPSTSTELANTLGYRKATRVLFCESDDEGEIQVPNGRYKIVNYPTPNIYCQFNYDFADGLSQTIRELGLMVGTLPKPELPAGKLYLQPHEVADKGTLMLLEHRPAIYRDQGVRESFEFVISF